MSSRGTIPPRTERAFHRRYVIAWATAGLAAVLAGLALGPKIHHGLPNPWISVVLAFALYGISALFCPVVLIRLWRRPSLTSTVYTFSIPVGLAGLAMVFLMRTIGPSYLYVQRRELHGLYLATALLYAASLVWAVAVSLKRQSLGKFDIDDPD